MSSLADVKNSAGKRLFGICASFIAIASLVVGQLVSMPVVASAADGDATPDSPPATQPIANDDASTPSTGAASTSDNSSVSKADSKADPANKDDASADSASGEGEDEGDDGDNQSRQAQGGCAPSTEPLGYLSDLPESERLQAENAVYRASGIESTGLTPMFSFVECVDGKWQKVTSMDYDGKNPTKYYYLVVKAPSTRQEQKNAYSENGKKVVRFKGVFPGFETPKKEEKLRKVMKGPEDSVLPVVTFDYGSDYEATLDFFKNETADVRANEKTKYSEYPTSPDFSEDRQMFIPVKVDYTGRLGKLKLPADAYNAATYELFSSSDEHLNAVKNNVVTKLAATSVYMDTKDRTAKKARESFRKMKELAFTPVAMLGQPKVTSSTVLSPTRFTKKNSPAVSYCQGDRNNYSGVKSVDGKTTIGVSGEATWLDHYLFFDESLSELRAPWAKKQYADEPVLTINYEGKDYPVSRDKWLEKDKNGKIKDVITVESDDGTKLQIKKFTGSAAQSYHYENTDQRLKDAKPVKGYQDIAEDPTSAIRVTAVDNDGNIKLVNGPVTISYGMELRPDMERRVPTGEYDRHGRNDKYDVIVVAAQAAQKALGGNPIVYDLPDNYNYYTDSPGSFPRLGDCPSMKKSLEDEIDWDGPVSSCAAVQAEDGTISDATSAKSVPVTFIDKYMDTSHLETDGIVTFQTIVTGFSRQMDYTAPFTNGSGLTFVDDLSNIASSKGKLLAYSEGTGFAPDAKGEGGKIGVKDKDGNVVPGVYYELINTAREGSKVTWDAQNNRFELTPGFTTAASTTTQPILRLAYAVKFDKMTSADWIKTQVYQKQEGWRTQQDPDIPDSLFGDVPVNELKLINTEGNVGLGPDAVYQNPNTCTAFGLPNIELTKTANWSTKQKVNKDGTVTYSMTVTNTGKYSWTKEHPLYLADNLDSLVENGFEFVKIEALDPGWEVDTKPKDNVITMHGPLKTAEDNQGQAQTARFTITVKKTGDYKPVTKDGKVSTVDNTFYQIPEPKKGQPIPKPKCEGSDGNMIIDGADNTNPLDTSIYKPMTGIGDIVNKYGATGLRCVKNSLPLPSATIKKIGSQQTDNKVTYTVEVINDSDAPFGEGDNAQYLSFTDDLSDAVDKGSLVMNGNAPKLTYHGLQQNNNPVAEYNSQTHQLTISGIKLKAHSSMRVAYTVELTPLAKYERDTVANKVCLDKSIVQQTDATTGQKAPACAKTSSKRGKGNIVAKKNVSVVSNPGSGAQPGDKVTYTVTVKNNGLAAAPVDLKDTLWSISDYITVDTGSIKVSKSDSFTATVDNKNNLLIKSKEGKTLAPNEQFDVTYSGTVTKNATKVDSASNFVLPAKYPDGKTPSKECRDSDDIAKYGFADPKPSINSDNSMGSVCARVPFINFKPNKSVIMPLGDNGEPKAVAEAGDIVTYRLYFDNTGSAGSQPLVYTDHMDGLLDEADLVPGSINVNYSNAPVQKAPVVSVDKPKMRINGEIAPGAWVEVTYQVKVKPNDQRGEKHSENVKVDTDNVMTNCLAEGINEGDADVPPQPCPQGQGTRTEISDYFVKKKSFGAPLQPGGTITYQITVKKDDKSAAPASFDITDDMQGIKGVADYVPGSAVELSHLGDVNVELIEEDLNAGRIRFKGSGLTSSVTFVYKAKAKPWQSWSKSTLDNIVIPTSITPPPGEPLPKCGEHDVVCTHDDTMAITVKKSAKSIDYQTVEFTVSFANIGSAPNSFDYTDAYDDRGSIVKGSILINGGRGDDSSVTVTDNPSKHKLHMQGFVEPLGETTITYKQKFGGEIPRNASNFVYPTGSTPPTQCNDLDDNYDPQLDPVNNGITACATPTYITPPVGKHNDWMQKKSREFTLKGEKWIQYGLFIGYEGTQTPNIEDNLVDVVDDMDCWYFPRVWYNTIDSHKAPIWSTTDDFPPLPTDFDGKQPLWPGSTMALQNEPHLSRVVLPSTGDSFGHALFKVKSTSVQFKLDNGTYQNGDGRAITQVVCRDGKYNNNFTPIEPTTYYPDNKPKPRKGRVVNYDYRFNGNECDEDAEFRNECTNEKKPPAKPKPITPKKTVLGVKTDQGYSTDNQKYTPGELLYYEVSFTNDQNDKPVAVDYTDDLTNVVDNATFMPNTLTRIEEGGWKSVATYDAKKSQIHFTGFVDAKKKTTFRYAVLIKEPTQGGDGVLDNVLHPTGKPCEGNTCKKTSTKLPWRVTMKKESNVASTDAVKPGDIIEYTVTLTNDTNTDMPDPTTFEADHRDEAYEFRVDNLKDVLDDAQLVTGNSKYHDFIKNGDYKKCLNTGPQGGLVDCGDDGIVKKSMTYNETKKTFTFKVNLKAHESAKFTYAVKVKSKDEIAEHGNKHIHNILGDDPKNPPQECEKPEYCTTNIVGSVNVAKKVYDVETGRLIPEGTSVDEGQHLRYAIEFENPGSDGKSVKINYTDYLENLLDSTVESSASIHPVSSLKDVKATVGTDSANQPVVNITGTLKAKEKATVSYEVTVGEFEGQGAVNEKNHLRNVVAPSDVPRDPHSSTPPPGIETNHYISRFDVDKTSELKTCNFSAAGNQGTTPANNGGTGLTCSSVPYLKPGDAIGYKVTFKNIGDPRATPRSFDYTDYLDDVVDDVVDDVKVSPIGKDNAHVNPGTATEVEDYSPLGVGEQGKLVPNGLTPDNSLRFTGNLRSNEKVSVAYTLPLKKNIDLLNQDMKLVNLLGPTDQMRPDKDDDGWAKDPNKPDRDPMIRNTSGTLRSTNGKFIRVTDWVYDRKVTKESTPLKYVPTYDNKNGRYTGPKEDANGVYDGVVDYRDVITYKLKFSVKANLQAPDLAINKKVGDTPEAEDTTKMMYFHYTDDYSGAAKDASPVHYVNGSAEPQDGLQVTFDDNNNVAGDTQKHYLSDEVAGPDAFVIKGSLKPQDSELDAMSEEDSQKAFQRDVTATYYLKAKDTPSVDEHANRLFVIDNKLVPTAEKNNTNWCRNHEDMCTTHRLPDLSVFKRSFHPAEQPTTPNPSVEPGKKKNTVETFEPGEKITYQLKFENNAKSGGVAADLDYTDDLTNVLDDAEFPGGFQANKVKFTVYKKTTDSAGKVTYPEQSDRQIMQEPTLDVADAGNPNSTKFLRLKTKQNQQLQPGEILIVEFTLTVKDKENLKPNVPSTDSDLKMHNVLFKGETPPPNTATYCKHYQNLCTTDWVQYLKVRKETWRDNQKIGPMDPVKIKVYPGEKLTYKLFFENVSYVPEASTGAGDDGSGGTSDQQPQTAPDLEVDYVDDVTDVIDDAVMLKDSEITANGLMLGSTDYSDRSTRTVTGSVPAGEEKMISYDVRVKDFESQGNNMLVNGLCPSATHEESECKKVETPVDVVQVAKKASVADQKKVDEKQKINYTLTFVNHAKEGSAVGDYTLDFIDNMHGIADDFPGGTFNGPDPVDKKVTKGGSEVEDNMVRIGAFDRDDHTLPITGTLRKGETAVISYSIDVPEYRDPVSGETNPPDHKLTNKLYPRSAVMAGSTEIPNINERSPELGTPDKVRGTDNPIRQYTVEKESNPGWNKSTIDGNTVTYTLTVKNKSNVASADVNFDDDLSSVLDDADLVGSPTATNGLRVSAVDTDTQKMTISGSLDPSATSTITYKVKVKNWNDQGDHQLANAVLLDGQKPTCNDTEHKLCTKNPVQALRAVKVLPEPTAEQLTGLKPFIYTVKVKNRAPVSSQSIDFTYVDDLTDVTDDGDVVPGSIKAVAGKQADVSVTEKLEGDHPHLLIKGTGLAGQETVTITYRVKLKPLSQRKNSVLNNYLVEGSTPPSTPPGDDCKAKKLCTSTPLPKLEMTKVADPVHDTPVTTDGVVTYTVTVTNKGQSAAPFDVTDNYSGVSDDAVLTEGPTWQDSFDGTFITSDSTSVIRAKGSLAGGQSATFTYKVKVNPSTQLGGPRGDNELANYLMDTMRVPITPDQPADPEHPDPYDPNNPHYPGKPSDPGSTYPKPNGKDVVSVKHPMPDLVVGKEMVTKQTVAKPGDRIDYKLTFENKGTAKASLKYKDYLKAVLDVADLDQSTLKRSDGKEISYNPDTQSIDFNENVPAKTKFTVTYSVVMKDTETLKAASDDGTLLRATNYLWPADSDQPPYDGKACPVKTSRSSEPDDPTKICTSIPITLLDIEKTQVAHPSAGEKLKTGDTVDYTVTFTNKGQEDIDLGGYVDDMRDVLDDAQLVGQPKVIDDTGQPPVVAEFVKDKKQISFAAGSTLGVGKTVRLVYTVKVKDEDARRTAKANSVATNFILAPGVTTPPTKCDPSTKLCTTVSVVPPKDITPPKDGKSPQVRVGLSKTGTDAMILGGIALLLLLGGGVLMVVHRRRSSKE